MRRAPLVIVANSVGARVSVGAGCACASEPSNGFSFMQPCLLETSVRSSCWNHPARHVLEQPDPSRMPCAGQSIGLAACNLPRKAAPEPRLGAGRSADLKQ